MKKGRHMRIFLLHKRYLLAGLGLLLAAVMLLAACLPELLVSDMAGYLCGKGREAAGIGYSLGEGDAPSFFPAFMPPAGPERR